MSRKQLVARRRGVWKPVALALLAATLPIAARALAAMVIDLLWDGARGAREVLANARPAMTRQSYVDFQRSIRRREVFQGGA